MQGTEYNSMVNNDKGTFEWLAGWHGEEHHLHRHQGLSIGLQVLLLGGEEHQGADVMGGGEGGH